MRPSRPPPSAFRFDAHAPLAYDPAGAAIDIGHGGNFERCGGGAVLRAQGSAFLRGANVLRVVVTNRGATGLVPLSYVTRVDEDGGKGSGGRGSSGRGSSSRRHGPLLLYARDKPREELEKMTVDELQRELDTLAAQLEKDVATLKLKYAKRKQHLESVVRGKASYAAQGGQ